MKKTIAVFGLLIFTLLLLLQLSNYVIISGNIKIEIVIAIIAIVFFFIGVYLNKKSLYKKQILKTEIDHQKIKVLNISEQEYEVLQGINNGLSNKEIADKLSLSENTIKTHVSNLFLKLNAKRRKQAIQTAKNLKII